MLGGLGNKLSRATVASASTIDATADVLYITGNTNIVTINPPPNGGFDTALFAIPTANNIVLATTGNIRVGATMAVNRVTVLIYNSNDNVWHIGAIS